MTAVLHEVDTTVEVARAAETAVRLARERGAPALLSHGEALSYAPDPLAFLQQASSARSRCVLWARPASRVALAGAGAAVTIRADGAGRFGVVSSAVREVQDRLVRSGVASRFPLIGGFAFAAEPEHSTLWGDFPDALLVAPEILLQVDDQSAIVRVTLSVDPRAEGRAIARQLSDRLEAAREWAAAPLVMPPGSLQVNSYSSPAVPAWESSVATAVSLIHSGLLDKIVLAREERLLAATPFAPVDALIRLREHDAAATLFAMQAGASWFIGATPERLVRLDDGQVDVTCLAGSIGMGGSVAERDALAARLLASEKDRQEHEIVVQSTTAALAEVCDDVTRLPGTPRVAPARSVQHLETPLRAHLSRTGTVLDLVERLHPTPAVGGYPRDVALPLLRELEEIERGWYAGPIGWTDLDGSGEFAVAIRSALLNGSRASLFAGCGIVGGSIPAAEYEETRLKLQPMIAALGAA
jgi:menaquinone-specific isochorismate synthase